MTRLYAWLAAIGTAIAFILTFGQIKERKGRKDERQKIATKNNESNKQARERIGDAIHTDDDAASAIERLRIRNTRNK